MSKGILAPDIFLYWLTDKLITKHVILSYAVRLINDMFTDRPLLACLGLSAAADMCIGPKEKLLLKL
jgi:hypothetical protein